MSTAETDPFHAGCSKGNSGSKWRLSFQETTDRPHWKDKITFVVLISENKQDYLSSLSPEDPPLGTLVTTLVHLCCSFNSAVNVFDTTAVGDAAAPVSPSPALTLSSDIICGLHLQ